MTTKAANGAGSLRQRADGKWEVRVMDPVTRKRRSAYFPTKAKAQTALRRMAVRADDGHLVLDSGATLRAYGADWLDNRAPRRRRESTVREYRRRLERYVFPRIGGVRLRDLTPPVVEDLYDELVRVGLSLSSLQGVRNALGALVTDAQRARHLSTSTHPVRDARMPESARRPREVTPPTAEQVGALLDTAADSPLGNLLVVLASTGARIGEALGAMWSDVDLDAGTWTVSRSTTLASNGSVKLGETTKTGDSRTVVLPTEALAALRAQRAANAAARLACPVWVEHDLLFPSAVGTVQDPRNVRKALRPLAEAAGFPGSFHNLRHFVASVAVSSVPLTVASKVLGHKRAATTSDLYAHLLGSDAGTVALAVSAAVGAARTRVPAR